MRNIPPVQYPNIMVPSPHKPSRVSRFFGFMVPRVRRRRKHDQLAEKEARARQVLAEEARATQAEEARATQVLAEKEAREKQVLAEQDKVIQEQLNEQKRLEEEERKKAEELREQEFIRRVADEIQQRNVTAAWSEASEVLRNETYKQDEAELKRAQEFLKAEQARMREKEQLRESLALKNFNRTSAQYQRDLQESASSSSKATPRDYELSRSCDPNGFFPGASRITKVGEEKRLSSSLDPHLLVPSPPRRTREVYARLPSAAPLQPMPSMPYSPAAHQPRVHPVGVVDQSVFGATYTDYQKHTLPSAPPPEHTRPSPPPPVNTPNNSSFYNTPLSSADMVAQPAKPFNIPPAYQQRVPGVSYSGYSAAPVQQGMNYGNYSAPQASGYMPLPGQPVQHVQAAQQVAPQFTPPPKVSQPRVSQVSQNSYIPCNQQFTPPPAVNYQNSYVVPVYTPQPQQVVYPNAGVLPQPVQQVQPRQQVQQFLVPQSGYGAPVWGGGSPNAFAPGYTPFQPVYQQRLVQQQPIAPVFSSPYGGVGFYVQPVGAPSRSATPGIPLLSSPQRVAANVVGGVLPSNFVGGQPPIVTNRSLPSSPELVARRHNGAQPQSAVLQASDHPLSSRRCLFGRPGGFEVVL